MPGVFLIDGLSALGLKTWEPTRARSLASGLRPTDLAEKNIALSPPGGGIGGAGMLFVFGESRLEAVDCAFPPFGVCGA